MSTTGHRWIAGFGAQFRRRLERGLAGVRNRKGLALLANFDDRALADIGLTRSDLYDALAQRIWDDPTTMLECRRTARRDDARGAIAPVPTKAPKQMLGVAGLNPPPTDRPARYFV
jgi:uncharacterized protein YjiS (DUF1127 family)